MDFNLVFSGIILGHDEELIRFVDSDPIFNVMLPHTDLDSGMGDISCTDPGSFVNVVFS